LSSPSLPAEDCIVVEFPGGDGYRSVARLVLGGLVSRFELPVDRVEDLLLALESLLQQPLGGDRATLEATVAPDGLRVRVGPFATSPLGDPAVSRVVTRLVDDASEEQEGGGGTHVDLTVSAARLTSAG
jgi:hypothetical protein